MKLPARILLVISAVGIALLGRLAVAQQHQHVLKVGVILPLSGEAASIGEAVRNGMELALNKLPPEQRERLRLIYEDDALTPKNTVTAFNKLTSASGVDTVVTISSGTSNAIASLTEIKQVPLLAIASDPRIVAGRKYAFNFWVTPLEEMRVLIPEAIKRGHKRIARISTIQEGVISVRDEFDKQNQDRLKVVLDEEFPPEAKDFKSYIAKLRSMEDVDGVFLLLMPGQLGIFAKQLRRSGVTVPLFGAEILEDASEVKASEGALIGAWYVNASDPASEFLKEYESRFPGSSIFGAANAHDIVLLLGKAAVSGLRSNELPTFFSSVRDFTGVTGTFSASGDNRFTLPASIKIVR